VLSLSLPSAGGAAATPKRPADVIVLGSSSINGALGILIEKEIEEQGYTAVRKGKSSSGFSRPDFYDWPKEAKAIRELATAKAVVVYMGTNDGQSIWLRSAERPKPGKKNEWVYFDDAPAWTAKYEERVRTFVQQLCDAGVQRVVVLTPMDVVNKKLQKRLETVRALQTSAAAATTCGKALSTSGDAPEIQTNPAKRKELRIEDGAHSTMVGSKVIWQRVEQELFSLLPPPPPAEPVAP
jgi:hypothetical protein